ncbi:MAG: FKBP-type peptidyl-prolyl cis-trans isomerase [Ferruginibacter sp.]|nr:FKBP-type peptidyl-prolyl cis-trans isomerase [Ferruginibacter sp.]
MKKIILCLAVLSIQQMATAQKNDKKTFKNSLDSFSYAAGLSIAGSIKQQGIDKVNVKLLAKGIEDFLYSKPQLLSNEESSKIVQKTMMEYSQKKIAALKSKGESFLAKNKKREGVVTLPNGLQYEILKSGSQTGPKPAAIDTVVVHYVGTLIDGTEFDNSIKRGEPAQFPLDGVIKGWTEILQLMSKGDKWKVYIPSELGYGDGGAPGGAIPPASALIFEIELLDIKPAVK